jgi:serine protease Do
MQKIAQKLIFISLIFFFVFWGISPALAANFCSCSLASQEQEIVAVIKKVVTSVVSIKITKLVTEINYTTGETYQIREDVGQGTGFIIDSNGLILTNRHVGGDKESEYKIFLNDGRRFDAKVADIDQLYDLALLKIEAKNLPVAKIGDSDKLELGSTVIVIGNALGRYQNSVTQGIVSGIGRSLSATDSITGQVEQLDDVIQTDAAINPGNSGGPLINLKGEAVGISTAIEYAENIGFAIPINAAAKVIQTYKKFGKIRRPFLGIRYMMITPDLKEERGLSLDDGALITYGATENDLPIIPGSPAEKAGLGVGDIIIEVNAIKIKGQNSLVKVIQKYNVGNKIGMKIWRSGRVIMRTVTLDELK